MDKRKEPCPADYGVCIAEPDACKRMANNECPIEPITKYPVICLCGSTKFKEEYIEATRILTMQGFIVLGVGLFGHADNIPLTTEMKIMLDDMHKRKIDMADEIMVINPGGYIGESTKSEIDYALAHNKTVNYMFGGVADSVSSINSNVIDKPLNELLRNDSIDDYDKNDCAQICDN